MSSPTSPHAEPSAPSVAPAAPALVVRGVRAGYPGQRRAAGRSAAAEPVLHGVDLTARAGQLVAVLGPSGCGKTTLLKVVAGLLPATAGHVELGGRVLVDGARGLAPEHRRIGLVPQDSALFPHQDVAGNVAFGLRRRGLRREERRARVDELLRLVGLSGLAGRLPHELSGGQRQRVALARALAPRPDLVLLDEPFSALDASLRTDLRGEVRDILHTLGTTTVLVTHDQDEALSMADRVVVLRDGRVVQDDAPAVVYERPADPWVAGFVGDSVVLPGQGEGDVVRCDLGTLAVHTPARGRVRVVLRPEQLHTLSPGPDDAPTGVVTGREYFGHDVLFRVRLDTGAGAQARSGLPGTTVLVRALSDVHHEVGDHVALGARGPVATFGEESFTEPFGEALDARTAADIPARSPDLAMAPSLPAAPLP